MRRPVPTHRSHHVRQSMHKGDAEIPTEVELSFLELEAVFKTRQDREKRQTWHSRIVAEMRQQLVKERGLDVTVAQDLGYVGSVRVNSGKSNAEQDKQEEQNEQDQQDGQDARWRVCLHKPNVEDLDAVFSSELPATNDVSHNRLFEHSTSAVHGSNAFQNNAFEPDLTSTSAASSIDVISFSSFEELLNHFPHASL
ncbi:hypothetical protein BJ741DRAFT_612770, partial [Chytriomyces cf. hyalinus JEL632]